MQRLSFYSFDLFLPTSTIDFKIIKGLAKDLYDSLIFLGQLGPFASKIGLIGYSLIKYYSSK
jgi:hypothetical protein